MKEKIIEIIGFMMEPERVELKAREIIILFNQRIVEALKKPENKDLEKLINDIFIQI